MDLFGFYSIEFKNKHKVTRVFSLNESNPPQIHFPLLLFLSCAVDRRSGLRKNHISRQLVTVF